MTPAARRLLCICFALFISAHALAAPVEEGQFVLHKFKQAIGNERYVVETSAQGRQIRADFLFTDRGSKVPLQATLDTRPDGVPLRLQLKGKVARQADIDLRVEQPKAAIFIGGYAPVSFQQEMIRRWIALGRPPTLDTAPLGKIAIRQTGSDVVTIGGRRTRLSRLIISGLIWGQESAWIDARRNLVALIGIDAEFDHFEALRPDAEPLLDTLLTSSTNDQLANLNRSYRLPPVDTGKVVAVEGATLIDGTGRPPVADAVVLMRGGTIVAAGPALEVAVPPGAQRIDARGKTIIPGLWDMHAHYEQVEWGPVYLAAGITTARDMANEFEYILALKKALAAGRGIGPRLLTAGLIDGRSERTLGVDVAETADQGRALVRRYRDAGFDQIKIYSSLKPDVLKAVVEEAHALGLRVAGHLPRGIALQDALDMGMDEMTHITSIWPAFLPAGFDPRSNAPLPAIDVEAAPAQAVIAAMKQHGVGVDPTMVVFEDAVARPGTQDAFTDPGIAKLPAALAANYRAEERTPANQARHELISNQERAILGAMHRAGIPVVAGTDQCVPGHSLHREMELYVKAGFTPMEALQSATSVPAAMMGLDKDSGTVQAGKRADLLILDANPLDDITNTRKIRQVIAGGRIIDPAPLWKMVGFKP